MSTTLNKLQYTDETKAQIKTALNQFDSGITDNDTFRSYVSKINNIYTNWEKVTGTGTDLILNNTKSAKMIVDIFGNSTQGENPSPTNPQTINNVTGNTVVKAHNKNLFNENTVIFITGVLDDNGQPITSASHYTENFYMVEPSTKYTFSGTITESTFSTRIYFYDENKNWISRTEASVSSPRTFTTPANCRYVRLQVARTLDLKTGDVQLEKGSTATPYVPYKENSVTLPLGTLKMCSAGTARDYFFKKNNKWYKKKVIDEKIFKGTEELNKNSQDSTDYLYYFITTDYDFNTMEYNKCNYLTYVANANNIRAKTSNGFSKNAKFNAIYMNIGSILETNTVNGMKAKLEELYNANTPIIMYFKLATPVDIEITDTTLITQLENLQKMQSYSDITYVSGTSENAQPILTATALKKGSE